MTNVLIRRNAPNDSCRNLTALMSRCTKTSFIIRNPDNVHNAAFLRYSADVHILVVLRLLCVRENKWKRTLRSHRRTPINHSEVVASILDARMSSVTPETTGVDRDNIMTETRDIGVFTPTPGLPRITTPARKTGRSRVAPAWQADYIMD